MITETPRCDRAYRECLDDTGCVTRMEPIWETMEALERDLSDMRENSEYWNKMAADLTNEKAMLETRHATVMLYTQDIVDENTKLTERIEWMKSGENLIMEIAHKVADEFKEDNAMLREALEKIGRRGPIMGSVGEYRQGQLDILEIVSTIAGLSLLNASRREETK